MCTKFYFNNLVPEAIVNPSTENALFPASNILDDRRTKVFRSTTNSDHVYFDFGAAESIDSFVAVGHTLNGFGYSTVSLELNNVATWTSGALATISVTIDTLNDIAHGSLVTPVNARYAKLIMTSTLGYCEVSKIFIGRMEEIGTNDLAYPLKFQMNNLGIVSKNRLGQKFFDSIASQKQFSGSIDAMTNDEVDVIYDLANQCSFDAPFFIRIEDASVFNDNDRVAGYYYLKDDPVFTYTQGGFWSTALNLEEGM
jgi:hypothetical protein